MKRNFLWTAAAALALSLSASAQTPPPAAPTPPPAAPANKPLPAPKDNSKLPDIAGANLAKIEAAMPAKAGATRKKARKILVFWRCEQFFHSGGIAGGTWAIKLDEPDHPLAKAFGGKGFQLKDEKIG